MNKQKDSPVKKIYYSIGEVARMFEVTPSLIRFWEKEFDVIRPRRNKKGNRLFTSKDIEYFHLIHHLVKEKGYTLKGARERLRQDPVQLEEQLMIHKTLEDMKAFLLGIKKRL